MGTQRFLENFLGLHVTPIGQVHIGFRNRIDIVGSVELAGRIDHRGARGCCFGRIDALSAACAEEGVRLQPAFEECAVDFCGIPPLPGFVDSQSGQQRDQQATTEQHERVAQQLVEEARFWFGRYREGLWRRRRCFHRC